MYRKIQRLKYAFVRQKIALKRLDIMKRKRRCPYLLHHRHHHHQFRQNLQQQLTDANSQTRNFISD